MFTQQFQFPFAINGINCTIKVTLISPARLINWSIVDDKGRESYSLSRHLTEDIANQITNHIISSIQ
jgi:hypothetical protein